MAKNRSELVAEVAGKSNLSKGADNGVLDARSEVLAISVATREKVSVSGWLAVARTERAGPNPRPVGRCESRPAPPSR